MVLFGSKSKKHSVPKSRKQHSGLRRFLKGFRNVLICLVLICVILGGTVYGLARFTNIPFFTYWRNLYIETAMTTMTHQWLATDFFPEEMIEEVQEESQKQLDNAVVEKSTAADYEVISDENLACLTDLFPMLDEETIPENMMSDTSLDISDAAKFGIKTKAGDDVWAIDWKNGILIVEVSGDQFKGKLAIIRDPNQVDLAVNKNTSRGSTEEELAEQTGALLVINASGFYDPDGVGDGLKATGLVMENGEIVSDLIDGNYETVGFDKNHNLLVGKSLDLNEMEDAVQFYPCIVSEGESNIDGTLGMGLQPRTVIGQASDGSILMLIIDGRQPGYSVGATVADCADILLNYDCWVAQNLDGGSSSAMWYKGDLITKCSSPSAVGRYLPDGWVVLPKSTD